jgi:hypothetical protein
MMRAPVRQAGLVTRAPIFAAIAALSTIAAASARDAGQWSDQPPAVREWFRGLMQPDQPHVSCCGESDAYEADSFEVEGDHYVAIITDGSGDPEHGKREIPNGTRITVPNHKMKWDAGNPTGHGVIFIGPQGQVFCFVTPGGV